MVAAAARARLHLALHNLVTWSLKVATNLIYFMFLQGQDDSKEINKSVYKIRLWSPLRDKNMSAPEQSNKQNQFLVNLNLCRHSKCDYD